jgi:hypothetical protein
MSKALVLGAAALVVSAASASAQVYTSPDYGYAEPVADLAAPGDGYAAPAPPPVCAEILIRFIWPTESPNVGRGCFRCYAFSSPYSPRYSSRRADLRQTTPFDVN